MIGYLSGELPYSRIGWFFETDGDGGPLISFAWSGLLHFPMDIGSLKKRDFILGQDCQGHPPHQAIRIVTA